MPETPQLIPSKNGFENTVKNKDGSIDLFISLEQPDGVAETNWLQTVKGRDFLVAIRLYGSGIEFFDQTWKPDDIVKLK